MKKVLLLLLIFSLGAAQASALERRPRKNRKAKSENTETQQHANPTTESQEQAEQMSHPETGRVTRRPMPKPATDLNPEQIDSLLAVWSERQALASYETFFNDYINLDSATIASAIAADKTPDSVYVQRLKDLVSPVPLCYNPIVKGYID